MNYTILIDKAVLKFIAKQPVHEKKRLLRAIYELPNGDTIKMSGKNHLYRLRVGSYRIIYTIANNELNINVIDAGNRGDIYK